MSSIIVSIFAFIALLAYQPLESDLIFDHTAHFIDREIGCISCHGVLSSNLSSDKNIPGHESCADCHSIENAPEDCALCHTDPDNPTGATMPEREIIFSHAVHMKSPADLDLCLSCHIGMDKATAKLTAANYPTMDNCFQCHDGGGASAECSLCHSRPAEMSLLIHDPGWKHEHKFATDLGGKSCAPCHETETFCSECHAGDNLVETVHELNYGYTHGLEANGKEHECQSCHETQTFCAVCHLAEADRPLSHIKIGWLFEHGEAAENDIENCAACHSTDSPTCARSGCHLDDDGIQGTNASIHPGSIDDLGHGPWHDDPAFQCFSCHANTQSAGIGFCGYCHDTVD